MLEDGQITIYIKSYNFIKMFDLKTHKAKNYKSVSKSNTTVALPEIKKIKTTDNDRGKNKSGYLQTISYISSNVDYQKKDSLYVNRQQNTLKSILKKMNYDTMELINHLKPKRSPRMVSKDVQNQTIEKQVENRQKLINVLENQIGSLKQKYKLIVEQHQDVEVGKKITSTKQQIEELRQQNVQRRATINKQGKQIQKYYFEGNDSKMNSIELDHHLAMNRYEKLKNDSAKVDEQNSKLLIKTQELEPFIQQLQAQCVKIKNKQSEIAEGKTREYQQSQKKVQMQNIKKKIQFIKNSSQVRYYKMLKDLQSKNVNCQKTEIKTTQIETRTKFAAQQIINLESLLEQAKKKKKEKGQKVRQYLASSRKLIQQDSRVISDVPPPEQIKTQRFKTEEEIDSPEIESKTQAAKSKTQAVKSKRIKVEEVQEQHLSENKQNLGQEVQSEKENKEPVISTPSEKSKEKHSNLDEKQSSKKSRVEAYPAAEQENQNNIT